MMLVPVGVAGIVFGTARWLVVAAGTAVALAGVSATMPPGTARISRGTPAALAAMTLFAVGYFGADSLITLLLTIGYHASLAAAAVVLGAAPLAWGVTSLVITRVAGDTAMRRCPAIGLAVSAVGVGMVALGAIVVPAFALALTGWTLAGVGVGLAYPFLYISASTPRTHGLDATGLATAVIIAEAFGGVLGSAVGGAISSHAHEIGLAAAYLVFCASLGAAAFAATRST